MGYEEHSGAGSGSTGVVVALTIGLVLLLLAGLAVVGLGALFWVRTSVNHAQVPAVEAKIAQDGAEVEVKQMEARVVPPAPAVAPVPIVAAPQREITIALDTDGGITVDGESATVERLKDVLKEAQQGAAVTVAVQAARRCDFGHVAAVQDACRECGIQSIRFAVAEED
jgi:biopolymer transport protein ExbD